MKSESYVLTNILLLIVYLCFIISYSLTSVRYIIFVLGYILLMLLVSQILLLVSCYFSLNLLNIDLFLI